MQIKVPARHCGDCQRIRDWHSHLGSFSFQMEPTRTHPKHKDAAEMLRREPSSLLFGILCVALWTMCHPYSVKLDWLRFILHGPFLPRHHMLSEKLGRSFLTGVWVNVTTTFLDAQVFLSSAECCLIFIPCNSPVWRLRKLFFIK